MISPVKVWRNQEKIRELLLKEGEVVSWTKIHVPPVGFEAQAPYVVVVVQFDDKKRYTAQLVDFEEKHLKIGQRVVSVLRRTRDPGEEGIIPYGIKFKPI